MKKNSIESRENFIKYCEKGKTSKIKELIEYGFDLDEMYDEESTLLDVGLTKLLIVQYIYRKKSIKVARLKRCIDMIFEQDANFQICKISFFTATCITGNFKVADKLIEEGFDVNQDFKEQGLYYDHVLTICIDKYGVYNKRRRKDKYKKFKMSCIQYLVNLENVDYQKCNNCLIECVKTKNVELLKVILKNKINLNKKYEDMRLIDRLFVEAINNKNRKIIEFLKIQEVKHYNCINAMNCACEKRELDLVKFFIKEKMNLSLISKENQIWIKKEFKKEIK